MDGNYKFDQYECSIEQYDSTELASKGGWNLVGRDEAFLYSPLHTQDARAALYNRLRADVDARKAEQQRQAEPVASRTRSGKRRDEQQEKGGRDGKKAKR
jgi:hypothetical protein